MISEAKKTELQLPLINPDFTMLIYANRVPSMRCCPMA